uniref:Uncharacterized protein n=1 Tax=Anguilla anguilla TaxID=7936 RepID=A0A0E9VPN9_ANGAN
MHTVPVKANCSDFYWEVPFESWEFGGPLGQWRF